MANVLVQCHTGAENPPNAVLGQLVAVTAHRAGHDAIPVLAGDAVPLHVREDQGGDGSGTRQLADLLAGLTQGGPKQYRSGMSATAHGSEFAEPDRLVALLSPAQTMLCD